jgi:hypothetical protein
MIVDSRPTVAAIVTSYWRPAHADVFCTTMLDGYGWNGEHIPSRVRIASLYMDQTPENDIGHEIALQHGVPVFETIPEAIGLGRPGVQVDGVFLIGEQGEYGFNELGQELYPRRRFFEAAVAAMIAADRFVPIFMDKHFSYDYDDAVWMMRLAERFNIPLLAGSSIPVTWRQPEFDWPVGTEGITEALVVAYGPIERYGYHAIELLQSMVERRAGGETGVRSVQCLEGAAVWDAGREGRWSRDLFEAAFATIPGTDAIDPEKETENPVVFLIEYADGLRGSVILLDGVISQFAFAGRRGDQIDAAMFHVQMKPPYGHGIFLIRQMEAVVLNRRSPYPPERTLLATGITEAVMQSAHQGHIPIETPALSVTYTAPESVPDTGLGQPLPEGWDEVGAEE